MQPRSWPRSAFGVVAGLLAFAAVVVVADRALRVMALPAGAALIPTSGLVRVPADMACAAFAAASPVQGVLRGDASETDWPVWLEGSASERAYVRWPTAWSARFDPAVSLLDEDGIVAARDGDLVTLGQVGLEEAEGSRADPYVATGIFLDRCYHRP